MPPVEQVLKLVDHIYDAAVAPSRWQVFLGELLSTVDASQCVLQLKNVTGECEHTVALNPADVACACGTDFRQFLRPLWSANQTHLARAPRVVTSELACFNCRVDTAADNRGRQPAKFFHLTAAVPASDDRTHVIVTALKPIRTGGFAGRDERLFHALIPHLKRAADIYHRFDEGDIQTAAMSAALDRMPIGVVVLGSHGAAPIYMNAQAAQLAEERDGFLLADDGVAAHTRTETAALRQLISRALAASTAGQASGELMMISRPSGKSAFTVLVAPASPPADPSSPVGGAAAVLFLTDPSRHSTANERTLRSLYGLTASEARIAVGLAAGRSVDELASECHLTRHSARWLVKQVLHKTGSRSQGQAISRILRDAAIAAPSCR